MGSVTATSDSIRTKIEAAQPVGIIGLVVRRFAFGVVVFQQRLAVTGLISTTARFLCSIREVLHRFAFRPRKFRRPKTWLHRHIDSSRIHDMDAVIICVQHHSMISHQPDLSLHQSDAEAGGPHLRPGQLIVL